MRILILAEHNNKTLNAATYHSISAGLKLAPEVELMILSVNADKLLDEAGKIEGVSHIHYGSHARFEHSLAEHLAPPIHQWLLANKDCTHFLAPATTYGKNITPRVAALMDVEQISDVIAIESPDIFQCPIYAGNAIITIQTKAPLKILTIRSTTFDRAKSVDNSANKIKLDEAIIKAETKASKSASFKKQMLSSSDRPELTAASIIVSGGRGLQSKENFAMIEKLADKLGAAIGASRAAVDANYVPNDYQVGQTGKVVAPDLYIAIGISGAIQHLAGMKDSKIIVAINKDEDAPIFQIADFGLVADLFDAVPEMIEKLG